MKWFTVIWAFYIMALSLVPCSDMHNRCNDTKPLVSAEQTHQHNQDRDDICTPFCHCCCCSVNMAMLDNRFTGVGWSVADFIDRKVFIRDFSFLSNYYGNIWQPPKINA